MGDEQISILQVSEKLDDEKRPEGMSWKDWLERLSWTATYHDGSLEVVVRLDYALTAVAELEKRLREANDPTWPQLSALS